VDKAALRTQCRALRRQITPAQRAAFAAACVAHGKAVLDWLKPAKGMPWRVGSYIASFSEACPMALENVLLAAGASVYWPRCEGLSLRFSAKRPSAQQRGAFGIPEPAASADDVSAEALDLILLPLLGFDAQGHRLGQGGGFYDRALAAHPVYPKRLGLAFSQQGLAMIPTQAWDQSLHALLSEQGLRFFPQQDTTRTC
jgi:5-formyltetrahydrofolate cyclo-ligase